MARKPSSPAVPEVFRAQLVPLAELAATLNRWHADGFTEDVEFYFHDTEPPAFGEPTPPQAFVFARRPDPEPEPPAGVVVLTRHIVRRRR